MPRLNFVMPSGESRMVEARTGQTVMEAATGDMVRGIIGECGGACSCATCHVYVDDAWFNRLPPPDGTETAMLDGAIEPGPLSRLSCQIKVTDDLDGLVMRIPSGQM